MQFPRLLEKNLYLHVPFFEKDDAEAAGAKWDKDFMLWFLPPGSDPLEVRRWWSFLGNAYDDRKTIKKMGAKFNGRLESWWVPNDLNFDDFRRWWPIECKQYLFNDRFCCHSMVIKSGQATVYKAWDLADDEGAVVKLFHPIGGSWKLGPEGAKRELDALLLLEGHPNILPLKDWGILREEKQYFTVTKWMNYTLVDFIDGDIREKVLHLLYEAYRKYGYLNGTTEEEYIALLNSDDDEDDEYWIKDFEKMYSGVLEGIAFAHENDIVHRDIKAGNIYFNVELVEAEDKYGIMHIEDFKIIPIIGDFGASKNQSHHTPGQKTGQAFRTEPWTPPHEGEELNFQKTWDIHAWGILVISSICEVIPHTYKEINELLDGKFKDRVGDDIHAAIARAIDPKPSNRPQDARQYLEEMKVLTEKAKKEIGLQS
ncbi:MAG: protein kinase [Nitrospinaceae bacterium]|jgi:serine/threonine protein kinase|nr:protein kinase [Nitrospinaceae bacterium]